MYVSTLVACVCHAAAPVTIRAIPTKNPKKDTIFVSMLASVPITGTGLISFCRNQEIAMNPPKIRMYSALFTKMLTSIFLFHQSGFVLGYFMAVTTFNAFLHSNQQFLMLPSFPRKSLFSTMLCY